MIWAGAANGIDDAAVVVEKVGDEARFGSSVVLALLVDESEA